MFFDRKPAAADPWTKETWVYDLRTNKHFTLKTNPLRADGPRRLRRVLPSRTTESSGSRRERFRRFTYDELVARDKANLDITWLRDESLDDASTLPAPGVLAAEIVEELEAALAQFSELAASLPSTKGRSSRWRRSQPRSPTSPAKLEPGGVPTPPAVLQFLITLDEVVPTVWRRLLVPGGVRLAKLHDMFQEAMGWTDSHLHAFTIGDQRYGMHFDDYPEDEIDENEFTRAESGRRASALLL